MKTTRIGTFQRLAILVGVVMAAQGAQAAKLPLSQPAVRVKATTPGQPRIFLASAACVRVGNRMVC